MVNQISINEVHPNPESGSEWLELLIKETPEDDFSLKNYSISDNYHQIYKFDQEEFNNNLLVIEVSGLNNDQDSVILKDESGSILDSFSYSQTEKGLSWSRTEDGSFVLNEPTPNQLNPNPSPSPTPTIVEATTTPPPTLNPTVSVTTIPTSISPTSSPTDTENVVPTSIAFHYDLSKVKLINENKSFKNREVRLVFLGQNIERREILNAIIGSSLVILAAVFLIYVKTKGKHP